MKKQNRYRVLCLNRYREVYRKLFNVNVDDGYEVHHIDNNHKNDDISNLLIIPRNLHRLYHKAYSEASTIGFAVPRKMISNLVGAELYEYNVLCEYIEVLEKCKRFVDFKDIAEANIKGGSL